MFGTTTTNPNGANLSGSGGPVGLVNLGWGFGNGLRAEIEGDVLYDHMRLKQTGFGGGTNLTTYGVMANALYDFNVGWPVVPYVGAGVGYEWTQASNATIYTQYPITTKGTSSLNSSTQGNFAAQGILGAAFPIAGVPGLALTAEYRFMAVLGNNKLNGLTTTTVAGKSVTGTGSA